MGLSWALITPSSSPLESGRGSELIFSFEEERVKQWEQGRRIADRFFRTLLRCSRCFAFSVWQASWYPGGAPGNSTTCVPDGEKWKSHRLVLLYRYGGSPTFNKDGVVTSNVMRLFRPSRSRALTLSRLMRRRRVKLEAFQPRAQINVRHYRRPLVGLLRCRCDRRVRTRRPSIKWFATIRSNEHLTGGNITHT